MALLGRVRFSRIALFVIAFVPVTVLIAPAEWLNLPPIRVQVVNEPLNVDVPK